MSQKFDYYKSLELTPSCTAADIKKSYRKLAMKWHPDKNPNNKAAAVEKFKEIAEAYDTLSKPDKRQLYDQIRESQNNNQQYQFGSQYPQYQNPQYQSQNQYSEPDPDLRPSRPKYQKADSLYGFGFHDFTFAKAEQIFRDFFKNEENDDFFGGSFGGMMGELDKEWNRKGDSEFVNRGVSKSISSSTVIKNGRRTTVTKTTYRNPDGTYHTDIKESWEEDRRRPMVEEGYGKRNSYPHYLKK